MIVFTTAHPDFAQAVWERVGSLGPEASGRDVDGESIRVELELPPITSSGTTIPAAITARPRAKKTLLVGLRDENRAMVRIQLRPYGSHT